MLTADPKELYEKFFQLKTRQDVANLLEVDLQVLKYHLYISSPSSRYRTFSIPKRSGGSRKISSPATALKIIQMKLNFIFKLVYPPKPSVHSFLPERNIRSNSEKHSNRRNVFNVDLKDFFPSINLGRVRGMFMAYPYKLDKDAATVLAQICCFNNELPQGAPTSPMISNMICARMDSELQMLAKKTQCFYTRYADDITFSNHRKPFPSALAEIDPLGQLAVGDELNRIISENGFEVNTNKIRLRTKSERQEVTGLTTNKFPNVRRKNVRQIRAMLHAWREFGEEQAAREFFAEYDIKHRNVAEPIPLFKQVVMGKIEFIGMVRGKKNPIYVKFRKQLKELAPELVKKPIDSLEHLLVKYDGLGEMEDVQGRGYLLEDLLNKTIREFGIICRGPFKRNQHSEQIDGAITLDGWLYLIECRWREKVADEQQTSGLYTKVERSGKQSMGIFLAINGWSDNVPMLLKQNPEKCILLMNGDDLRRVLNGECNLKTLIQAKVEHLNYDAEPFYAAKELVKKKSD